MPFPKKIPKLVTASGRLIAQIRCEVDPSIQNSLSDKEKFVYLVVQNCGEYDVIFGVRSWTGRMRTIGSSLFSSCANATWSINSRLEFWKRNSIYRVVEGKFWEDTEEGKAFSERFLADHPEIRTAVRVGQREPSAVKKLKPKTKREILPRSAWMARHYPDRVTI